MKDLSIKELRQNLSDVADRVEKGKVDAEVPEERWETVVDFTEAGKTKGVSIQDVMKEMRKL